MTNYKKNIICQALVLLGGIIMLAGLGLELVKIELLGKVSTTTGFSILESYPNAIKEVGGGIGIYVIIHIIFSFSLIGASFGGMIGAIARRNNPYKGKRISLETIKSITITSNIILCVTILLPSLIFMICGAVAQNVATEAMDGYGEISGNSYVMFILNLLVAIAIIVLQFIDFDKNKSEEEIYGTNVYSDLDSFDELDEDKPSRSMGKNSYFDDFDDDISNKRTTQKQAKDDTLDKINQLKEFKSLLDSGIITQEEFDKKKKELLGL